VIEDSFQQHVRAAGERPEVVAAVGRVYADLQARIDERRPVCVASGRCCKFEEFGHRLYVTTLELAAFLHQFRERPEPPSRSIALPLAWDGTGCPFQAQRLCGVHDIRPFGCRVFFCDLSAGEWQNEVYEQFHSRLKRLHEELSVPYFYMEWRDALRRLGLAPGSETASESAPSGAVGRPDSF
jgi:Fe-S-cluster containining protein